MSDANVQGRNSSVHCHNPNADHRGDDGIIDDAGLLDRLPPELAVLITSANDAGTMSSPSASHR
jgi:hypothetical protein